jgi:4-diphosphocytidyl-2-C-methyl-D-erythritol kinase
MELLSPAKINLFLHVTGLRNDGYHELDMLMCAVSLYDTITLDPDSDEYSITCSNSDIPADDSNLAMRAARLFGCRMGGLRGVSIHLEKRIPAGAGLGGGSSNAATVLTGLNRYFNQRFSTSELLSMAEEIGSDVPFFIEGRPARVGGRGERLDFVENILSYHVVILHPGIPVSTASVYKKLNFGLTKSEKAINSPLLNKGLVDPIKHLYNDLETPAFSLCAEISGLKDVLTIHGAEGVLMSGSGSSVFGLYSNSEAADRAYADLGDYMTSYPERCSKWQLYLAKMIV